jgi:hypothetical protein
MVPIEKSAVKIVVFNNFKALGVEFTNTDQNFCLEIIHSGVSSLCICNYEWTNWLANNDVYMNLPKQSFELVKLEKAASRPNFHFYYVAKIGEPQSLQNFAMMRLRATHYSGAGETTLQSLNQPIPNSMRKPFFRSAYCMRPTFYDFYLGIALEPCVKDANLCNFWQ